MTLFRYGCQSKSVRHKQFRTRSSTVFDDESACLGKILRANWLSRAERIRRPACQNVQFADPDKMSQKSQIIQKNYVRNRVRFQHFVEVQRNAQSTTMSTFRTFRSTNHVVSTVKITKLCLCAFDNKRSILDDGVHTLAYGHFSLNVPM